jgi:superoxide dismutase
MIVYFKNFSIKVKKEIKDYNSKAHLMEVAQKYNLVLNEFTRKDKKAYLSQDDNDYSKRIDNQLRSMNVSVWHCALTIFALYREFVIPNNLSNEFEYEVSKEIADIFLSNEKFKSKLITSKETDIKELGRICQTMKDRRTQFGDQVTSRKHEA